MHVAIERNSWRIPQDDVVQVVNPKLKIKDVPDELAYAGLSDGQYWRSVILALLVIALVIAGIVSAILIRGFVDELLTCSGERLTLNNFLDGDLFPQRLPSMWISPTEFVYQTDDGSLSLFNTTNNNVTTLVSNYTLSYLDVKEYQCSPDLKYILLKHNLNQVFKNIFTAHFTIYTVSNDHQTPLIVNRSDVKISELQSADWAGNTNNLVIVENNDIYIKYETNYQEVRITYTGIQGIIYNGIPDWLYQEEIFIDSKKAYWPSADGSHLLYATFNDSLVQNLEYPWMEDKLLNRDLLKFPTTKSVRYPMPGTNIPEVKLWITNITLSKNSHISIEIHPPEALRRLQDYYLTSAGWVNYSNSRISAIWMSRLHNLSIVSYCEAPSWKCEEKHVETATVDMWLEVQHHPIFAPDGKSYLLLALVQESGLHYFTQIKHITLEDKRILIISHGRYEVLQILAWDTINHMVYYIGTDEGNTGKQHLYVVNDQTAGETTSLETRCLTCDDNHYQNCSHFFAYYNPINMNTGIEYYALECNGPSLPVAGIHYTANDSLIRILFNVQKSKSTTMEKYALPTSMFESIPLHNGYTAKVQLLLPPSWRPELRDAAFPVIVQVNGKPNSQLVTRRWKNNWGLYMSSRTGIVYIKLDVRGSKGQTTKDLYMQLGDIEVKDQIAVIKKLLENHKYLDENRVGVWGWGYGGYVTTMLMNSRYEVLKCGIAVSPIADWRYYNSAFTEKILGLKTESNDIGYVQAGIQTKTNFITNGSFYIIQGLADLSVPYQHGIMLAKALTHSKVLFKHQIYANEGHDLNGVLTHMYESMEDYFKQCLMLEDYI